MTVADYWVFLLIEGFFDYKQFSSLALMEDLEELDYSSDRLESSDIWEVPGGGLMEQLVDIPRLG